MIEDTDPNQNSPEQRKPHARASLVGVISETPDSSMRENDSSFPSLPTVPIEAVRRFKRHHSDNGDILFSKRRRKLDWRGEPSKKQQKRILLLGEGPMYYAVALLAKHPEIATQLLVTEFRNEQQLVETYGVAFEQNLQTLRARGVEVRFGIDARKIHRTFAGYGFSQIHFNAPYGDANEEGSREAVSQLCRDFFASCAQLQANGQKIYLALPDPENPLKRKKYANIYQLSAQMGVHKLYKKRAFKRGGELRYPGYRHVQTSCAEAAKVTENMMELVFVKQCQREITQPLATIVNENTCHEVSSTVDVASSTEEIFFSQMPTSQSSTQYDNNFNSPVGSFGSPPFTFSPVLRAQGSPTLFSELPPLRLLVPEPAASVEEQEYVTGMQRCSAVLK
jgi:hypothetical protein